MKTPAPASPAQRIRALSARLEPRPTDTVPRVRKLTPVRAVLFDVYGTLFVSGSGEVGTAKAEEDVNAVDRALEAVGLGRLGRSLPPDVLEHTIRRHHEHGKQQGVEYPEVDIVGIWRESLAGRVADTWLTDEHLRRLAVEYECRSNPVWPMPGARELIETLEQRGMLMGIVSNAQFYTPLVFEALLEKDLVTLGFRPELCAWSYQSREAKPSRRLFQGPLEVLDRQFATPPQQVLYIGNDMLNDIWPASRLGCRTALFAGDRRSLRRRVTDPRCRGVEPDVVVTALDQLLDVL